MKIRFGSVCSGIEAASCAWNCFGWEAAWFAEIEPFPCAVLAHHYPGVPNLGDMTTIADRIRSGEVEAPDMLCGGTPCQAFSVAGLRRSLDDARGNLSLVFCELADAIDSARASAGKQPAIIFWENVPGVLSVSDNAFGCFVSALAGADVPAEAPGGKWPTSGLVAGGQRQVAWRVLDAQYFGVPQRRRRVFVVASAREDICPAEILFELEGVSGNPSQGGSEGQGASGSPEKSPGVNDFSSIRGYANSSFGKFDESSIAACVTPKGGGQRHGGDDTIIAGRMASGSDVCGCLTAHDLEQQVTTQTTGSTLVVE